MLQFNARSYTHTYDTYKNMRFIYTYIYVHLHTYIHNIYTYTYTYMLEFITKSLLFGLGDALELSVIGYLHIQREGERERKREKERYIRIEYKSSLRAGPNILN